MTAHLIETRSWSYRCQKYKCARNLLMVLPTHLRPQSTYTHTNHTTTKPKPARPPAKHAQRLGFSYKPRPVPSLSVPVVNAHLLSPTQWWASHKERPHSRLFSHSILTARGSISGRMLRQCSQVMFYCLWPEQYTFFLKYKKQYYYYLLIKELVAETYHFCLRIA